MTNIIGYLTTVGVLVTFALSFTWHPPAAQEDPNIALGRTLRKLIRMLSK